MISIHVETNYRNKAPGRTVKSSATIDLINNLTYLQQIKKLNTVKLYLVNDRLFDVEQNRWVQIILPGRDIMRDVVSEDFNFSINLLWWWGVGYGEVILVVSNRKCSVLGRQNIRKASGKGNKCSTDEKKQVQQIQKKKNCLPRSVLFLTWRGSLKSTSLHHQQCLVQQPGDVVRLRDEAYNYW